MQTTYATSLTSTQAGGAVSAKTQPDGTSGGGWWQWRHSVQAAVTLTADGTPAVATAGTLSVRGKVPGGATFQELGTINLPAPNPVLFEGYYSEIQAVSTGFDADKTWTLNVVSGD